MNTTMTSCLKIDQLAAYLDDPDAPAAVRTSLHLAQCRACRSRVDTLAAMKAHLGAISGDTLGQTADEGAALDRLLGGQAIERFVAGELAEEEASVVRRALAETPQALKAALHFAESSAAMQRELPPDADAAAPSVDGGEIPGEDRVGSRLRIGLTALLDGLRRRLRWRTLLWTALPSGALAAGILFLALTLMESAAPLAMSVSHCLCLRMFSAFGPR
jgi:anti-sigma factor RsiW